MPLADAAEMLGYPNYSAKSGALAAAFHRAPGQSGLVLPEQPVVRAVGAGTGSSSSILDYERFCTCSPGWT